MTTELQGVPGADLVSPRVRWPEAALCFVLTLAVYAAFVPQFLLHSSPPTGDQPFYLMEVASLAQDGDLDVSNNYADQDYDKFYNLAPQAPGFSGMSAPYPLPGQFTDSKGRPPAERYSFHLPGLALWLLPAWTVGSWYELWWPGAILGMCVVGALVGVNVYLLSLEVSGRRWIAAAVWAALAFSSPIFSHSYLIFTELPAGLLAIYCIRRLALGWSSNGRARLILVGLCISYIPWLALRCVIVAAPLLFYALTQCRRANRAWRDGASTRPRSAWWLMAPGVLSGGLMVGYSWYVFGSVLPYVSVPEVGDRFPFSLPWASWKALMTYCGNSLGLLFDSTYGLLPYAPVYLLAAVGAIAMASSERRTDRRLLLSVSLIFLPYLGLITAFDLWNGIWCFPARYLTTLAPVLSVLLAMSLAEVSGRFWAWPYRVIFVVLAVYGFGVMAVGLHDARLLWPIGKASVFEWLATPDSPLKIDLRDVFPSITWPDEVSNPLLTGRVLAGSLLLVLFGHVLLGACRRRRTRDRKRLTHAAVLVLGWAATGAVAGAAWYAANFEYTKHKSVAAEQRRWRIEPALAQPYGIAHLDGSVFITDYAGGSVRRVELATGVQTRIEPFVGAERLAFKKPGDVKVGAEGLLYILNNGDGDEGLFVMKPDGEVVHRFRLEGMTTIAVGLSLPADGTIFVADMFGGLIRKYGRDGGAQLLSFGGQTGAFNNVAGVLVDTDGLIYAAETSYNRVQQFDQANHFVRNFEMHCPPNQMVLDGDWIDVTCSKGILSLNTKNGLVQRTQLLGLDRPMAGPTGIAHGPDGTLLVLDQSELIAFKLEH